MRIINEMRDNPNITTEELLKEVYIMCDLKRYSEIYKEIIKIQPEETLQLVMNAENEEEQEFYQLIGNYLLQKKQKQVIEMNLF